MDLTPFRQRLTPGAYAIILEVNDSIGSLETARERRDAEEKLTELVSDATEGVECDEDAAEIGIFRPAGPAELAKIVRSYLDLDAFEGSPGDYLEQARSTPTGFRLVYQKVLALR